MNTYIFYWNDGTNSTHYGDTMVNAFLSSGKNKDQLLRYEVPDYNTMKTKLEIIEETSQYNSNTRAVTNSHCEYKRHDGKMCAVGRCLSDKGLKYFLENCLTGLQVKGITVAFKFDEVFITPDNFDQYLKEEYQGHEYEFWQNMQIFHDSAQNWNEDGLTEYGQNYKILMISKWC